MNTHYMEGESALQFKSCAEEKFDWQFPKNLIWHRSLADETESSPSEQTLHRYKRLVDRKGSYVLPILGTWIIPTSHPQAHSSANEWRKEVMISPIADPNDWCFKPFFMYIRGLKRRTFIVLLPLAHICMWMTKLCCAKALRAAQLIIRMHLIRQLLHQRKCGHGMPLATYSITRTFQRLFASFWEYCIDPETIWLTKSRNSVTTLQMLLCYIATAT
jgi:hypothetical protein